MTDKTVKELLIEAIHKHAIPHEYYYDYYFMNGKIHNDCPSQEELLKIIQDLSRGIGEDLSKIIDKLE